ncbi:hypothetical protein CYMTET_22392, partial [Cymbomonas tetramitiformis]
LSAFSPVFVFCQERRFRIAVVALHRVSRAIRVLCVARVVMGIPTDSFLEAPDDNFICPICREVYEDAVTCPEGHGFCSACIKEALRVKVTCPVDRHPLHFCRCTPSLPLRNLIRGLKVYCSNGMPPVSDTSFWSRNLVHSPNGTASASLKPHPERQIKRRRKGRLESEADLKDSNSERGVPAEGSGATCTWTGRYDELKHHLESTCPVTEVGCSHSQCAWRGPRGLLVPHTQTCKWRPDHLLNCRNKRSGCEERYHLSNKAAHLVVCRYSTVKCPMPGCNKKMARHLVADHIREAAPEHLVLLSTFAADQQALQARVERLEARNKELEDLARSNRHIWEVEDFEAKLADCAVGSKIHSPQFRLAGATWRLKLYPKGVQHSSRAPTFISVCIAMVGSSFQETETYRRWGVELAVIALSTQPTSSAIGSASAAPPEQPPAANGTITFGLEYASQPGGNGWQGKQKMVRGDHVKRGGFYTSAGALQIGVRAWTLPPLGFRPHSNLAFESDAENGSWESEHSEYSEFLDEDGDGDDAWRWSPQYTPGMMEDPEDRSPVYSPTSPVYSPDLS